MQIGAIPSFDGAQGGRTLTQERHTPFTGHRAGVEGGERPGVLGAGLITLVALIALVALAVPRGASAKQKDHRVHATMALAIIGQSETGYEFVARLTGKPLGTAAAVGETVFSNTP